ncbi:MAG: DUF952 domain-containing protein [Bacteroidota bacterium]
MILHITTPELWEAAKLKNSYTAPSLNIEGFIHCSTAEQITHTANRFYKSREGLILLVIEEDLLESECKWEAASDTSPHYNNVFPHIYGPINISAVTQVIDFPVGSDGQFVTPAQLN